MGFSSHLLDLKNRDKLNARYLKKGSYFRLKKMFLEAAIREGVNIKSATPNQIRQIKEKIREQREKEQQQKYKAIIGSIVSGVLVFYLIGEVIRFIFFK